MMYHNDIRDRIGFALRQFVKQNGLGHVTLEADFQLSEDMVRRPDVVFIGAEKMATINPHELLRVAPDLAIEVASPSDRPDDLMLKVKQYLIAGTAIVLVISPEAHLGYLYRGQGSAQVTEAGPIELLPGFRIDLDEALR